MGNRQKLRQAAVKQIEQDLLNVSPADLEFVGHSLIKLIEDIDLIHRGLNRDAKPVGYTVDTFSDDRAVVGEYSTDTGYFEAPYDKIKADSKHAKDHAPNCKRVYLMSNCGAGNSDWKTLQPVAKNELPGDVEVKIYDGRRLAETLYDQVIEKNNLIEYFADFLPSLMKVWTENAISHARPETPMDYVPDSTRIGAIVGLLAAYPVIAIYGISGIGKSYAAIDYATTHAAKFRNVIWVAGTELVGMANLAAVKIARMGEDINLSSKLSTSPCLLVIDNWRGDAASVMKLLPQAIHPETRVLITCIGKPGGEIASLDLPPVCEAVATSILHRGILQKPSQQQTEEICRRVGWHPLTLAIISATVREDEVPWQTIVDDLPNVPNYQDADHETILQRILLNHSDGAAEELRTLKMLGTDTIDASLAMAVLGVGGLAKLLRRSLLKKDIRGICRVHDLIRACLNYFGAGSVGEEEIHSKLKGFFALNWETGSYHFHRSLQFHAHTIRGWVNIENPEPSLESYLFQLAEGIAKPALFLDALRKRELKDFIQQREACVAIIEAIEHSYNSENDEPRRSQILDDGIKNITEALQHEACAMLKADLFHHRGKLLFWRRNLDEALNDFDEVLKRDPKAFQSHLQMARVKAKRNDPSCSTHVEAILSAFDAEQEAVSITLALGAYTELEKRCNQALRRKWLESDPSKFQAAINLAAAGGFSQPYRTLGRLSRYISYLHPQALLAMAELVSFPPAHAATAREYFEIAECMKNVGKARFDEHQDEWGRQQWCERALDFYDRIVTPKDVELIMKAECLILLKRCGEALDCLSCCKDGKTQANWWQRRAQAQLQLGTLDDALNSIEQALNANRDGRYLSALLRLKSQIELEMGSPQAVSTLEEALSRVDNPKFKVALEQDLIVLRKRFSN